MARDSEGSKPELRGTLGYVWMMQGQGWLVDGLWDLQGLFAVSGVL